MTLSRKPAELLPGLLVEENDRPACQGRGGDEAGEEPQGCVCVCGEVWGCVCVWEEVWMGGGGTRALRESRLWHREPGIELTQQAGRVSSTLPVPMISSSSMIEREYTGRILPEYADRSGPSFPARHS